MQTSGSCSRLRFYVFRHLNPFTLSLRATTAVCHRPLGRRLAQTGRELTPFVWIFTKFRRRDFACVAHYDANAAVTTEATPMPTTGLPASIIPTPTPSRSATEPGLPKTPPVTGTGTGTGTGTAGAPSSSGLAGATTPVSSGGGSATEAAGDGMATEPPTSAAMLTTVPGRPGGSAAGKEGGGSKGAGVAVALGLAILAGWRP